MLPEQIWDAPDIPEKELFFGKPSGSAMPLVWAHAEYVKLRRSLHDGRVFDTPPQTVQRYQVEKRGSLLFLWRLQPQDPHHESGQGHFASRCSHPAEIHWSADYWRTAQDLATRDTGLGVHVADLPSKDLPAGGDDRVHDLLA